MAFAIACAALIAWPAGATEAMMRDQNGSPFLLRTIGAPVVLTFVSAHCVDACPIINAQFAQMQEHLRLTRLPIRLLTLTLDPQHDRAKDMRQIARTFAADRRYWIVGTGSPEILRSLMHRFGVTSSRGNREYDDIHTTFVYLLDKRGRFVKTILASNNLSSDLFAELQREWNKLDV